MAVARSLPASAVLTADLIGYLLELLHHVFVLVASRAIETHTEDSDDFEDVLHQVRLQAAFLFPSILYKKVEICQGMRLEADLVQDVLEIITDRKSTRLNSSHQIISYAVFCLKK